MTRAGLGRGGGDEGSQCLAGAGPGPPWVLFPQAATVATAGPSWTPPWHLVSPAEPPSCTAKAPSALQAPAKAELPPQEHWLSEKPLPCSPSPMMPPSAPTTPAAPSGVKTLADLSRAESRVLSVGSS